MKYLTLYPNIISFIIDTSVSRDAGVLKTLFNLAFLVGCSGSSAKKLDLSSAKNYGQIDNYLSQNKIIIYNNLLKRPRTSATRLGKYSYSSLTPVPVVRVRVAGKATRVWGVSYFVG
jgi:hypothetical protein